MEQRRSFLGGFSLAAWPLDGGVWVVPPWLAVLVVGLAVGVSLWVLGRRLWRALRDRWG